MFGMSTYHDTDAHSWTIFMDFSTLDLPSFSADDAPIHHCQHAKKPRLSEAAKADAKLLKAQKCTARAEQKTSIKAFLKEIEASIKNLVEKYSKSTDDKTFGQRHGQQPLFTDPLLATSHLSIKVSLHSPYVQQEMDGLFTRMGVCGFAVFSQGHLDDPTMPETIESRDALCFLKEVLHLDALDVVALFKQ
ncbi:hypothetical protein ARMSODRAFT_1012850 [Armillaria solidipes]|uniref:Uncharacterized protein n=1 Tax=Armillaria solidipes TaxID=1076256 RepID=A0A2H3BWX3_9AGAR|nr:hypothetical protein ARMSODRAFT_1012850 [Armillaria solidipes]